MKTKQNKRKIIIAICMAVICTIITCIPIFALENTTTILSRQPEDIDLSSETTTITYNDNKIHKIYIKMYISTVGSSSFASAKINMTVRYTTSNNTITSTSVQLSKYIEGPYYCFQTNNNIYSQYSLVSPINCIYGNMYGEFTIYLPVFICNAEIINLQKNAYISSFNYKIYESTLTSNEQLMEYYQEGYTNGFNDAQNIQQYTNLVGYVEQLIGQFTGDEVAKYITPIAVVLVILFVYFLFIRFLLSLIKAKGVIKTCDIIMIIASILILLCMYAPMFNLTLKTETVNSDTTYEVAQDTEVIRRSNLKYWDEVYEDRIIHYGPVGTWTEYIEKVTNDIYKIEKDVDFTEVTREQNDYNRE